MNKTTKENKQEKDKEKNSEECNENKETSRITAKNSSKRSIIHLFLSKSKISNNSFNKRKVGKRQL